MKRKAEESWAGDPLWAPRQGCCQPSLFCDAGVRRSSTASASSNTSDETLSLSSSPYMFMNLAVGATPSAKRSAPSIGSDVIHAGIGGDDSPEAIAKLDGEKLLASEMQALSVNEREEIYEEIHIGVRKNAEESPEFIKQKLHLFEQQLVARHQPKPKREPRGRSTQLQQPAAAKQPYEHPSAYQQALFLAPRYVKNPNFRLLFLRSESFDVAKAAAKFVKHFELKKKFFGADKLGKAIDFFDLEDGDVEALRNGAIHVVPNVRDRSGRRVFLDNYHCYRSTNNANYSTQARLIWYSFMREMEKDVEAQRRGAIAVLYAMGISPRDFAKLVVEQRKHGVVPALPLLSICAHFCMDNPQLRPIFSMFLAATPKPHRLRARIHFGSDMECQYAISTYGIDKDLLPYASDGSVKPNKMEQIVATFQMEDDKHRTDQTRQETNRGIVSYATSADVLVGKSMQYQNSKGTLRMLQLVEQSVSRYIAAEDDRFTKTTLFLDVLQVIKRDGGRFLKRHPDSGNACDAESNVQKVGATSQQSGNEQYESEGDADVWVVLDDGVAREKVAAAFRSMVRRLKTQKATLVS